MSATQTPPEVGAVDDAPSAEWEKPLAAAPVGITREALLDAASTSRDEAEVDVPGLGVVLVGEISGDERARIMEAAARAIQAEQVDIRGYQKQMLAAGILDPSSPKGARVPLLRHEDIDAVMKLGAAKIRFLIDEIERLSGMGAHSFASAEKNSAPTPSESSTSV